MKYIEIFDLVRHIFEFLFYLVTGPLVTVLAVKKITQKKNTSQQLLELHKKIREIEERERILLQERNRDSN